MPAFDPNELRDRANERIDRANERIKVARDKTETMQVKNAVALIAKKFQPFLMDMKMLDNVEVRCMNSALARLMGPPPIGATASPTVVFMDAQQFTKAPHKVTGRPIGDCLTAGTTLVIQGVTYSYINRSIATPGTIIHEMLHFLTHRNFVDMFRGRPDVIEGVTEHFTRVVQGQTSLSDIEAFRQFTKELSPRKGRYTEEVRTISTIDKSKLEEYARMKFVMEKAYFKGDGDAIGALKFALDFPEWFALVPRSDHAAGPSSP